MMANDHETARIVLEAMWPAITEHFAKMSLADHHEGMRCLVEARTELERRVGDLKDFEREYRIRLAHALRHATAVVEKSLDDLDLSGRRQPDPAPPGIEQISRYMRLSGWTPSRGPAFGTMWERPRHGTDRADRLGMVNDMQPATPTSRASSNGSPTSMASTSPSRSQPSTPRPAV